MKKGIPFLAVSLLLATLVLSCTRQGIKTFDIQSPGKSTSINVTLDGKGQLTYRVNYSHSKVIRDSKLGLRLADGGYLGDSLVVVESEPYDEDETYPIVAGKSNSAHNHFNGMHIKMREKKPTHRVFILDLRAYDDGAAFRYIVPNQNHLDNYSLVKEETHFTVDTSLMSWPIRFKSFSNNYEEHYLPVKVGEIRRESLVGVPFVFREDGKFAAAITEAGLEHYAGMYLHESDDDPSALSVILPPNPDFPGTPVHADSLLLTPWRVIMVAPNEAGLIASNLILNLNDPLALSDTSWIKPGRVAWDWWSGQVVKGKGFEGKMDDRTMEYFIDFASESGFEYMLIDAGWYGDHRDPSSDVTITIPAIHMEHLVDYASKRHVGILLWVNWKSLDNQLEKALSLYQEWGIKGIKIDYMDADNQPMVDYYHRVVKAAARHHLMVDFHGAYKPTGLRRTYPNLMTREGILGLEYLKWSSKADPEHNVTIPFTRMLAGPMDYTPGGFNQVPLARFDSVRIEPKALGTRCHQLAMYVVYESPLQMVSDHPAAYRGQKGFEFIRMVPASWDETYPVDGKISDFIILARRKGDVWYAGGMSDWTPRTLSFETGFLKSGTLYHATIFRDADDSDVNPKDLVVEEKDIQSGEKMTFRLAPGGGFAIRFTPKGGGN